MGRVTGDRVHQRDCPSLPVTHGQSQPHQLGHPCSRTVRRAVGAAGSPGSPQSSEMDPGSLGQQMQTKRLGDSLIPAKSELGAKSEVWAGDCFHFLLDVTSPVPAMWHKAQAREASSGPSGRAGGHSVSWPKAEQ